MHSDDPGTRHQVGTPPAPPPPSAVTTLPSHRVSPNKMAFTLREVLPEPEEVEKILEEIDSSAKQAEAEEEEEPISLQDGRLLLTGTSEETDV